MTRRTGRDNPLERLPVAACFSDLGTQHAKHVSGRSHADALSVQTRLPCFTRLTRPLGWLRLGCVLGRDGGLLPGASTNSHAACARTPGHEDNWTVPTFRGIPTSISRSRWLLIRCRVEVLVLRPGFEPGLSTREAEILDRTFSPCPESEVYYRSTGNAQIGIVF